MEQIFLEQIFLSANTPMDISWLEFVTILFAILNAVLSVIGIGLLVLIFFFGYSTLSARKEVREATKDAVDSFMRSGEGIKLFRNIVSSVKPKDED